MVFAEVALGAIVLTFNVILLGGELVFFQAVCLLGYCLFPLVVAAIVCASTESKVWAHLPHREGRAGCAGCAGKPSRGCRMQALRVMALDRGNSKWFLVPLFLPCLLQVLLLVTCPCSWSGVS